MKSHSSIVPSLIALIAVAGGLYWYFFAGTGNQPPLSIGEENEAQSAFQALVIRLQSVSFDTSIFSDARFNALVDQSVAVAPESVGRLDPFAPIPGVGEE